MTCALEGNDRTVTFVYHHEDYVAIFEEDRYGRISKTYDKDAPSARAFYKHLLRCGYTHSSKSEPTTIEALEQSPSL